MPVDVFLPLLPKVYPGPQRISPSSLVYHCVACVLVSLQKEGAAYARKGARPEPIAARAWRIGRRPIARAPKEEGFCVHEKGVKYRDNMVEAREFWRFYGLQTGIGD